MSFERPQRPSEVEKAIKAGDTQKLSALGKAGGIASGQRREERRIFEDLDREMHEEGMRQAAEARRDDLLPEDN